MLQYASSVSSYAVLHLVSHLTFTIINVLKRLFIIVAGMVYTHQALRPLNTLGVVLAIGGILAYNIVKDVGAQAPSVDLLHPSTWAGWFMLLQVGGSGGRLGRGTSRAAPVYDYSPPSADAV